MSDVLVLDHIARTYRQGGRELPVLTDASLTLKEGELVALVGPSGSGKSTLLVTAGLLDTPQGGAVAICGEDASRAGDARRTRLRNRHIGFVYQFHHLLPELTARENILLPQWIAGAGRAKANARADELLERLGLAERAHHRPAQLSGGEQQRVAIGRALANKPALLLADEPTGNLDPATSGKVCDLLLEIAREQKVAALIATHNPTLAERLHRRVTIKDGKVVAA